MIASLKLLADNGDISPLSYFFASFIAEHSDGKENSLLAYSAALVSQNNQNGDVCVELDQYLDRPLFNSERIAPQDIPCGIDLKQWRQLLLQSVCVGAADDVTPLILDHNRLYLNRYWRYESSIAESIVSRLQALPEIDAANLSQQLVSIP